MSTGAPNEIVSNLKHTSKKLVVFVKVGSIRMATAPLKWNWPQWMVFFLFTMAVIAAFAWQWPIHLFFRGDGSGVAGMLAAVGRNFGDFQLPGSVGLLLALAGCATGRENWMEAGAALLAAAIIGGIINLTGQFIFAEQRPYEGGAMIFFALHGHGVSGHATSAALLLWPITKILFRDDSKFKRVTVFILLLSWACLVAWSRMWNDRHFLWNVMLGMAVGFSSGYSVAMVDTRSISYSEEKEKRRMPPVAD